ncbi:MAG: hypothetical protein E6G86_05645 [Alphaproteobacteria bacterium]|nr:MAG: hypothetical protein E6G86_05645 [Alphaproteobacteria bacterium]
MKERHKAAPASESSPVRFAHGVREECVTPITSGGIKSSMPALAAPADGNRFLQLAYGGRKAMQFCTIFATF